MWNFKNKTSEYNNKKNRLTNIEQTSDYHLEKGKSDGQDRRKGLRGANCNV